MTDLDEEDDRRQRAQHPHETRLPLPHRRPLHLRRRPPVRVGDSGPCVLAVQNALAVQGAEVYGWPMSG
jgi:hypothetical protein